MHPHYVIPTGTQEWWLGLLFSLLYAACIGWWAKFGRSDNRRFWERIWGISILFSWLGTQFFLAHKGWWRLNNDLPLHLCGISNLMSVAVLLFKERRLFVPLFFWGIVGGLQALLTPQVTAGNHPLLIAEYYLYHTSIILVPSYMIWAHGWRIQRLDWLWALLYNNLLILPIFGINLWLGANYMYLIEPPHVDNPLIIGQWPYYILGFEAAALLHYFFLSTLFRRHWKPIPPQDIVNAKF
jgi:hypothetical integral membrane protein (TIGR02206 family)